MREDWEDLAIPGRALETWVVIFRASRLFLEAVASYQLEGRNGHVEWLLPTIALRENLGMAYVQHSLSHGANQVVSRRAIESQSDYGFCDALASGRAPPSTFDFCCRAAVEPRAEDWFSRWRATGQCSEPMLLHPVKGDLCGRFSVYPRCWQRRRVNGSVNDAFLEQFPPNAYTRARVRRTNAEVFDPELQTPRARRSRGATLAIGKARLY